ncbi:MAG: family N-acetyltransferase [Gammaproteobacteria bacterium]|nr:family N-acetyltransferase [Gammaproteobacteria bacterium]
MDVKIRQATPKDLAALRRFQQGVVDAERRFDPTLKEASVHYYDIERMIDADHVHFLVADVGDESIGCGFARIEAAKPWLKHAVHAYFGLMYVAPAYRGRSVNEKIVTELKRWCRSRGVRELRLEVYLGNRGAIQAYRKAGFSEHMVEMRLELDG